MGQHVVWKSTSKVRISSNHLIDSHYLYSSGSDKPITWTDEEVGVLLREV